MDKRKNWTIIIFILIMISALSAADFLQPDREFSERENRGLEQKPDLTAGSFFTGDFSADYERYVTDQFIRRDDWIKVKTTLERLQLKQEMNDVYFAADGYLIEKHTGNFEKDTARLNISFLAEFVEKNQAVYGENGISVMIVPNAVKVLEEKLPPYASPYDEELYLKQIKAALPEEVWIDALEVLMEHKAEEIYYRTDHHYKTLAAYYLYQIWSRKAGIKALSPEDYEIETVSQDFLGTLESKIGGRIVPDSIQIYVPKVHDPYTLKYGGSGKEKQDLYEWSALETKDKYSIFFGGNHPVAEAVIENESSRKLLVIKDSYANCFLPFTFQDFGEVDFVDLRYYNESLRDYMNRKDYTDVLFLYNAAGFAEDSNLGKLRN